MNYRKSLIFFLLFACAAVSLLVGGSGLVGAAPSSAVDESKVPHYFGPYPNYANSPFTLADAIVTIAPSVTSVTGNPLIARPTPTDGAANVFVVNTHAPLADGVLTSFQTWAQAGSGTSTFNAYVLRPDPLIADSYKVVLDSGPLTVLDTATGLQTFTLSNPLAVQTGDLIAHYGRGIPLTIGGGADTTLYPAGPAPVFGQVFTLGVDYPVFSIDRTYSFAATAGMGATATATVGANGAITGVNITDPGSGYTSAPLVAITDAAGTNTSAIAVADAPSTTGSVTSITVDQPGGEYTLPLVTITDSSVPPGSGAKATAYGSVYSVTLQIDPLTFAGYSMPTVEFELPDDPNGVQATGYVVCAGDPVGGPYCNATPPATVIPESVVVVNPGSGYALAPNVYILDGTRPDPIRPGGTGVTASATLAITSVMMDTFGSGYTQGATSVAITESDPAGVGTGAMVSATVETGAITGITVTNPGSGYVTPGGMRKFIDPLPGMCDPAGVAAPSCPTDGSKYIPLAVSDTTTYTDTDTYEIALVQFRMSYSSDLKDPITNLPVGTLTRGYVQIDTGSVPGSQQVPLMNELLDGTLVNTGYTGVTPPQYLGPIIAATKDKPVRIVFHNLLPTGSDGDLFLPVDTTVMGSGPGPVAQPATVDNGVVTVDDTARNPLCGELSNAKAGCFSDNRATLHLHGGITPWISDGTPHQWITPAGENTQWPQGVSVENVPDMNVCQAEDDGCQTFYYTNQQSARFMFYHDHAWGITRLNVYAGEAAGYLISDATEQKLIANGTIPAEQIPLVIQDKTFVPGAEQLAVQDPTWDTSRWGGYGSMWAPHVYMPAQNPGDPTGMSPFGRWMYGPWFWPPADPAHGPIANPYYNMDPATDFTTPLAVPCDLNDPTTWQYQTDPFCEPELMPGTPNISVGMEAFNDTPIVNGTAYPEVTLAPKSYRLRILNAANDRFWNLQWYVADPTTGTLSEVALNPAELAAAQTDPVVFPTPDTTLSPPGPDWIQIGTEGGFLPAPVVVPNQPTTWITDPTVFNVGNVDQHSLLLAPAERADVIVDFSQFAGQTLILYNDAPAAFPARVPGYDYYTGGPDLYPVGAPTTLPGYGPNTRTVMRVTIAGTPAPAFNMTKLENAFKHKLDGSGVFEEGQNPIVVGQAAYNSAYGTNFVANGWCNAPGSTSTNCDGFARIAEQGGFQFGFNTLNPTWAPGVGKMQIPLQPKGIHDEMNATNFDEYGRMEANIGLEAPGATPLLQNIILYPYVNPASEIFDATNLPVHDPDIQVEPISSAADGTQIWKITHNGVDTHPIHWHLYDLQLLNRVTWDNIVQKPEPTELGWKDTIRISPLEDTIVAIRPIIPTFDFPQELPNSVRPLNPMMPLNATVGFNNTDAFGNPTDPIINEMVNFGWEYVFHCHILSHEEMDMMRPVSVAMPPRAPSDLAGTIEGRGSKRSVVLTWADNSITETSFTVKRALTADGPWTVLGTVDADVTTFTNPIGNVTQAYWYQVFANNEVGYGGSYSVMTVTAGSNTIGVGVVADAEPAAPTNLTAVAQAGPQVLLSWTDNATNETGFIIERAPGANPITAPFATLVTLGSGNGNMSYTDTTVTQGGIYTYRVFAVNSFGPSAPSNEAFVSLGGVPAAPGPVAATAENRNNRWSVVALGWTDVDNETGYTIQRATNATFTANVVNVNVGANVTGYTTGNLPRSTPYYFRVLAFNGAGPSPWVNASPFPIVTP